MAGGERRLALLTGRGLFSAVDNWQALSTLLEAFGNSPVMSSATRFSQILPGL